MARPQHLPRSRGVADSGAAARVTKASVGSRNRWRIVEKVIDSEILDPVNQSSCFRRGAYESEEDRGEII